MEKWRNRLIKMKGGDMRLKGAKGMTIPELSRKLGISERALHYYLKGREAPWYVQKQINKLWRLRKWRLV